jgi:hypothetical protein
MRTALYATAVMNLAAAISFLPGAAALRAQVGLPAEAPPVYLLTVALFVGLFGVGYFWAAYTARGERIFITMAALGKLGFFSLLVWYWMEGSLPLRAPVLGSADLVFSMLFFAWLFSESNR